MAIRPQIPAIEGVSDPQVASILAALKSAFDKITGRTPNSPQIKLLSGSANLGGTISKINEIVNRLQDATATSVVSTPIDVSTVATTDAATQAEQEAGTNLIHMVTPGRQQFHPSAAKAWHHTAYSGGTPTLGASYNVSSITDNGVGDLLVVVATLFSATNYPVFVSSQNSSSNNSSDPVVGAATTQWNQLHFETGGAATDPVMLNGVAFGDQ